LVNIEITVLKDEAGDLQEFLKNKLGVEVKSDGKVISVGLEEDKISRGKVKEYIERFFYRKDLSKTYLIRNDKDLIKIIKKKA